MAFELPKHVIPGVVAAGDLSTSQFLFCNIDSNGKVEVNTVEGALVAGVLQDKPVAGQAASVATAGVSKVVAGAAVDEGVAVMSNTSGQAIPATTTLFFRGVALTAGDAGEIISILLAPTGYLP